MATTPSSLGVVVCLAFTAASAGAGPADAEQIGSAAPVTLSTVAAASKTYPGGGIFEYGDAVQADPLPPLALPSPVVAMVAVPSGASTTTSITRTGGSDTGTATTTTTSTTTTGTRSAPAAHGFWLASADGRVTGVDRARSFGSAPNLRLYAPIVGMAAAPDGQGYWLVAADGGGVFSFGDAVYYGSMVGKRLAQSVVGIAATPDGRGYWLVEADGAVFAFGDATFYGSLGGKQLWATIAGMAATPSGTGYWLLESNGVVFPFGTARNLGEPHRIGSPTAAPFKTIVVSANGGGYSLLEPDGFRYTFANPTSPGGYPSIVAEAASQIGPDPDSGYFCNPYGPCEPWCALFVTWAWRRGGVPIPSYGFVGSIYYWAARQVISPSR